MRHEKKIKKDKRLFLIIGKDKDGLTVEAIGRHPAMQYIKSRWKHRGIEQKGRYVTYQIPERS